jgi:hypothetical protein
MLLRYELRALHNRQSLFPHLYIMVNLLFYDIYNNTLSYCFDYKNMSWTYGNNATPHSFGNNTERFNFIYIEHFQQTCFWLTL